MLNLGQLNTINAYIEHGQFEALDEYLSQVYSRKTGSRLEPLVRAGEASEPVPACGGYLYEIQKRYIELRYDLMNDKKYDIDKDAECTLIKRILSMYGVRLEKLPPTIKEFDKYLAFMKNASKPEP